MAPANLLEVVEVGTWFVSYQVVIQNQPMHRPEMPRCKASCAHCGAAVHALLQQACPASQVLEKGTAAQRSKRLLPVLQQRVIL